MTDLPGKAIGCIGAGTMGSVIASRIAGSIDPARLFLFDIDGTKSDRLRQSAGLNAVESPDIIAAQCDIIILAIKPDVTVKVLEEIAPKIRPGAQIVSVAAGVTLTSLGKAAGADRPIARVMPNTPALVGAGMSAIAFNAFCDDECVRCITEIFGLLGKTLTVPEKLMDAVTGLSGSGPAYVFTFIQALADGGVKCGIPRESALLLAAQTVYGSALYCMESGADPIALRGKVTSPGGTTIDAVHVLEKSGFSGIVMEAVETAAKKSEKLGVK